MLMSRFMTDVNRRLSEFLAKFIQAKNYSYELMLTAAFF